MVLISLVEPRKGEPTLVGSCDLGREAHGSRGAYTVMCVSSWGGKDHEKVSAPAYGRHDAHGGMLKNAHSVGHT